MNYDEWGDRPVPSIDPESKAFWERAQNGELAVQYCEDCDEHQFYPRELCRHCWSRNLSFEAIEGGGEVYSYTICWTPGQPGYDEETPYPVALVELDIPSTNPSTRPVRMTSHVADCPPEDLHIGMAVSVTFRQISDEPPISLPVFRPKQTQ